MSQRTEHNPEKGTVKKTKKINAWLTWGIKTVVTLALLYMVFKVVRFEELKETFQRANHLLLIPALILLPVNLYLQAARWRLLASTEVPDLLIKKYFENLLIGFTLGLATPGRFGEIGRVMLFEKASKLRLAGLHVLDKFYFAGATAFFGPLLVYLIPGFSEMIPGQFRLGVGIIALILPLVYLYLGTDYRVFRSLMVSLQLILPGNKRILEVLSAFDGLRLKHSARAVLMTLAQLLIIVTQFYLISSAFQQVNYIHAIHTYMAVMFVKSVLPISMGSLGVGEWASISFYQQYGIREATALGSSLLLFAMNVLLPALVGLFILLKTRAKLVNGSQNGKQRRSSAA